MLARFKDPNLKQRIHEETVHSIRTNRGGGDPNKVQYAFCKWDTILNGKILAEVTRDRGREVTLGNAATTAVEIEITGGCKTVYHAMNEEDVARIMQYPGTMISSDGEISVFGEGVLHPRSYGSYPHVLGRYVHEKGALRLEDAIRKMTSLPAQRIDQFDRGLLRPGMKADIILFDEQRIIDLADFGEPHQYAEGLLFVIVNGQLVLDLGKITDAKPGRVLYGPGRRQRRAVQVRTAYDGSSQSTERPRALSFSQPLLRRPVLCGALEIGPAIMLQAQHVGLFLAVHAKRRPGYGPESFLVDRLTAVLASAVFAGPQSFQRRLNGLPRAPARIDRPNGQVEVLARLDLVHRVGDPFSD